MESKSVIIISLAFILLIPISTYAEESLSYAVIKFVEKQELKNTDLAVVEFFVKNNSNEDMMFENSFSLIDSKNRTYQMMTHETEIILNNGCMASIPLVPSDILTVLKLCFELPKNNEDFMLLINHEELNASIPLYLETHDDIEEEVVRYDLRKVFVTINDVEIKESNIGDIVIADLFLYNGYFSQGKYEKTSTSIQTTTGSFHILGLNSGTARVVWDVHLPDSLAEECKKPDRVYSDIIMRLHVCFKRPIMGNGNYDPELFLKIQDSGLYSCATCQQKMWELAPYLNTTPEPIVEPELESKIPEWVRNIFKWYGDGQIGEEDLINGIKFLIKEGIIKI